MSPNRSSSPAANRTVATYSRRPARAPRDQAIQDPLPPNRILQRPPPRTGIVRRIASLTPRKSLASTLSLRRTYEGSALVLNVRSSFGSEKLAHRARGTRRERETPVGRSHAGELIDEYASGLPRERRTITEDNHHGGRRLTAEVLDESGNRLIRHPHGVYVFPQFVLASPGRGAVTSRPVSR